MTECTRGEAIDKVAGSEPAEDAGAAAHREGEGCGLRGDSVIVQHGRHVGDEAIFAEGGEHDDGGEDPEGPAAQSSGDADARGWIVGSEVLRDRLVANEQGCQRRPSRAMAPRKR